MTIGFLLLIVVGGVYYLVWPNTFLSSVNISFWPKPVVRAFLNKVKNEEIKVRLGEEEKTVSRLGLGIELDVNQTMSKLSPNSISKLIDNWYKSLSQITFIQPVFGTSENTNELVAEKISKKTISEENFAYDRDLGLFVYQGKVAGSTVNVEDLTEKLTNIKGTKETSVEAEKIEDESELKQEINEVNKKIVKVYEKPLEIVLEGASKKIKIESKKILALMQASANDNLKNIEIKIDKLALRKIFGDEGVENISIDWTAKRIENELAKRLEGGQGEVLVLGVDTGPNTDGSVADKYIEVDISQQRLYFFENGEVFKSYPVSTGQYYPTPTGSYKIMNKSEIGYSGIFKVWMPYWMAFDYRKDLGAYLGIHELPYMLIGGEKIYRFGNYIGTKKTGGCIALSPGDSKEVYDKTNTGMDLVIYQ